MPSRPLFWLTVFFMFGIAADRLLGESLPVQTHCFAIAAIILIAAMAIELWRGAGAKGSGSPPSVAHFSPSVLRLTSSIRNFAVPALLFVIFGMWASKASTPQFPQALKPFLNGQPTSYIAEVSASPEYYPDKIRIPLRLICAITGDGQTPLDGGVLLSIPRKDPANPTAFLPPPKAAANPAGGSTAPPPKAAANPAGGSTATPPKAAANPAGSPGFQAFFLPGDRVLFRTALKRFRSFRNPGGFDYVRYQAGKGLYAHCFLKDERLLIKIAPASGTSPGSILNAIRGRIELFRQKTLLWVQRSLDPEPAAFYAAMILGYKMLLDRNWQDHIHQTGLNHLLSVSGLHIGMVSMFVFWLVRLAVRFLFPSILNRISDKQIALWPALASAVLYAFLAGFGAPDDLEIHSDPGGVSSGPASGTARPTP